MKKIFAVDLDGVICDTQSVIAAAMRVAGIEPSPLWRGDDPPTYDVGGWCADPRNANRVLRFYERSAIYLAAKPYPGSIQGFRFLQSKGPVVIITARGDGKAGGLRRATFSWLGRYGIEPDAVIFCRAKEKVAVAKVLGVTHAFEDCPWIITLMSKAGIRTYYPQRPYTDGCPGTPYESWERVKDMEDLQ